MEIFQNYYLLLSISLIQQSFEHKSSFSNEKRHFIPRIIFSLLLLLGISTKWVLLILLILGLLILNRFQGPYNGGCDRMTLLILCCLNFIHFTQNLLLQEIAFLYLALQVTMSYFIAGWVKITNPDWRSGQALKDIFHFSAYPASEAIRSLKEHPNFLFMLSWFTILIEFLFPLAFFSKVILYIALGLVFSFHLGNTLLFGFNRFLWIWLAAYPSLIWLQGKIQVLVNYN